MTFSTSHPGLTVGVTLVIGLWTQPFLDFSLQAADQLLQPSAYLEAVLPERAPAGAGDVAGVRDE